MTCCYFSAMQSSVINSLKFAAEKEQLCAQVPVADLVRLADTVQPDGALDYAVTGDVDSHGRPRLHVTVQGTVTLQCQRCLGELRHEIGIDNLLWLVSEKEFEARQDSEELSDPDEPDCITAGSELDVLALVEDEILLALPPYPRHADGECMKDKVGSVGKVANEPAENVHTAFSALVKLRK